MTPLGIAEPPAAYLLGMQLLAHVRGVISRLDAENDFIAITLQRYAEGVASGLAAAEAPFAGEHRLLHYRIAWRNCCGCTAMFDLIGGNLPGMRPAARTARKLLDRLERLITAIVGDDSAAPELAFEKTRRQGDA
ncbi:MAG TPA: hypothetical protein VJ957_03780 [Longimicrobiales bacterium]|nr:hypothetical protein [Longimicrobiales bacterium]